MLKGLDFMFYEKLFLLKSCCQRIGSRGWVQALWVMGRAMYIRLCGMRDTGRAKYQWSNCRRMASSHAL